MRRVAIVILMLAFAGLLVVGVRSRMEGGEKAAGIKPFPCKSVGDIDRMNFPEPSDIVWHPTRKSLFVVSDNGHIAEIKADGTLVNRLMGEHWRDYEGVTVNPATGLVYVGVEGEEKILEIDPETLKTKREFAIERTFEGKAVMAVGGNGIEGLTFVSDEKNPEGGTFLVSNQVERQPAPPGEESAIFEVRLPLKTAKEGDELKGKIVRRIKLDAFDLSALCWDAARQRLYVLSDVSNLFYELTLDGKVMAVYKFPGRDQEGLAVDPDGFVYVAQDSGGILKLKWLRDKEEQE